MARQSGPLKYKGTLGDIRHFKIKGLSGHFAGMKGGPDGEQVLTAPEFARTRENMNEFAGSAKAAKSIRVGLSQLMKQMSDSQLTGRLTAIMKKINLEDVVSPRGFRSILITTQPQYFTGLPFNKNVSFDGVFYAPFTLLGSVGRDSATLTVPAFNPASYINAPAGATHFRLVSAISVISDFKYNATSGIYEPVDAVTNELSNIAYSNYLDLSTPIATSTVVTSTLPGSPTMSPDVSVLNCIGIEFYQAVGSNYYIFNSGNALKVKDVF